MHLWPNEVGGGLTMPLSRHSVGAYQETSSHATRQGTLGHSRLSSLSHWTDSGIKSGISVPELISIEKKKKKSASREWIVEHSPQILAGEGKASIRSWSLLDSCNTRINTQFPGHKQTHTRLFAWLVKRGVSQRVARYRNIDWAPLPPSRCRLDCHHRPTQMTVWVIFTDVLRGSVVAHTGNLCRQFIQLFFREHAVTVVSAHWATVDWSWPKEWNKLVCTSEYPLKKKKKIRWGMTGRTFSKNPGMRGKSHHDQWVLHK